MKTFSALAVFVVCSLAAVGAARATEPRVPAPGAPTPPAGPTAPVMCPMIYKPVCAGGRTFGNACTARAAGFSNFKEGACATGPEKGRCKPGEMMIFRGTRSERCAPAPGGRTCGPNEVSICTKSIPPRCHCLPKGGGVGKLCPPGTKWQAFTGVFSRLGGRCVPAAGKKCPKGMKWVAARCPGCGSCVADKVEGPGKKVCPPGTRLTQVMCIQAPCPGLCLPVGRGPVLDPRPAPRPMPRPMLRPLPTDKVKPL